MLRFDADMTPRPKTAQELELIVSSEAYVLADDMAGEFKSKFKQAITTARAINRGELINSVDVVSHGGSRGLFQRNITAARQWVFVDRGRRAGAPMPVRVVGTNERGKPIFASLMAAWFLQLNIPTYLWWPIMRRIAERGIEPKHIQSIALRNSEPRWRFLQNYAARRIAERYASRAT
jgi:hypothetical protein